MSAALLTQLLAAETTIWQALVKGDAAADAAHLDDTFLGVYPSGFATKAEHVGQLHDGPTIARFELHDAKAMSMGEDHALLAYRAQYLRCGGESEEVMYVASIWRRGDAGWVNIFSQDTPAAGD